MFIVIKDVNGQTAQLLKKNAFGELVQLLTFIRDANGNCLSQIAFDPERTIITEWEYDAFDRVIHT